MDMVLLLVIGVAGVTALTGALSDTGRVNRTLHKVSHRTRFPKALGILVLVVQASEVATVFSNVSLTHLVAALLLFAMVVALRPGSETEIM